MNDVLTYEFDEIRGMEVDRASGAVVVGAEARGGEKVAMIFHPGAVGRLLAAMSATPLAEDGGPSDALQRPVRPKSIQPFQLPGGEVGVAFLIGDTLTLPVIVPREAIASLREAADTLEARLGPLS